jgi:xylitol oxidase
MSTKQKNWAGNYEYSSTQVHYPQTVAQVQELVQQHDKLKVLGSRHSFNSIADSTTALVSLERLDPGINIDRDKGTVTVAAGVKYGQLCEQLHQEGYALHNLASLPHISVAGACATATHGSGDGNGNLATAVTVIELVTANGEVVVLSGEEVQATAVHLGAVGIITKLTLHIMPTFDVKQNVYEQLPFAQLENHFDTIFSSAYSVSLFTDWRSNTINQLWLKQRVADNTTFAPEALGMMPASQRLHPIVSISAEPCTEQMGIPGPWYERLPHFRMAFTPSSGEELQSEYYVPHQHAFAALTAVNQIRQHIAPLLMISEIRTIAADNLWLSPCYQQACVAIHFTWQPNWSAVKQVLPLIEEQLAPFSARPHWGKLFTMPPAQVQSLYKKLPDFQQLLRRYDAQGKFRNAFLDTYILGID